MNENQPAGQPLDVNPSISPKPSESDDSWNSFRKLGSGATAGGSVFQALLYLGNKTAENTLVSQQPPYHAILAGVFATMAVVLYPSQR